LIEAYFINLRLHLTSERTNRDEKAKFTVWQKLIFDLIQQLLRKMDEHRIATLTPEQVKLLGWPQLLEETYLGSAKIAGTQFISDESRAHYRDILASIWSVGHRFGLNLPLINFMEDLPADAAPLNLPADDRPCGLQWMLKTHWKMVA
jgi:hypothetical protein